MDCLFPFATPFATQIIIPGADGSGRLGTVEGE